MQLSRLNTRVGSPGAREGLLAVLVMLFFVPVSASGEDAVVRGKIEYSKVNQKSWDGLTLTVPLNQLKATLREQVEWPMPAFPAKFDEWDDEDKLVWSEKFLASKEGKKFLEQRETILKQAKVFDIKFDSEGQFVVYDVPPGTYALSARLDRQIEKTTYVFELFAQLEVLEDVDEVSLPPLQVEITPILKTGDPAPPFELAGTSDDEEIKSEQFNGKFLLLNFWTTARSSAKADQETIQKVYSAIKANHDLRLLSINVDNEQDSAIELIKTGNLTGVHGMTQGLEHPVLFNYGVRSVPSLWLLSGNGKIAMTPSEIALWQQEGVDLKSIISDRISGKKRVLPSNNKSEKSP